LVKENINIISVNAGGNQKTIGLLLTHTHFVISRVCNGFLNSPPLKESEHYCTLALLLLS
jgi:hypothetical protein